MHKKIRKLKSLFESVQQDGSLFKMPLELASFKDGKTQIKLLP